MTNDAPREGYVKTPLWVYDLNAVLSGARWKIIGVISRETYGWGRDDAPLTAQEIAEAAGLHRTVVSEDLVILAGIGLVRRTQHGRSFLLGLNPMSPSAVAAALDLSEKTTRPNDTTCRKKRQVIVGKNDRLLSEKTTGSIKDDRSGKIGKEPPPPTPATAAPGGGGGESHLPDPPRHPETIRLLAAAGVVTAADFGDIPPATAQAAIDQAARHPNPRNGTAALVGGLLAKFRAGRWQPTGTAPTERPPSDRVILEHPALDAQTRATWLARFRQAAEPAAKRGVLARLAEEVPYA